MLINQNIEIHGHNVVLVPYGSHLVPKYHAWMQSEDLLKATASERLTLVEEYEMQKSWGLDDDKLTFIVLNKDKLGDGEEAAMIGDANLFILNDNTAEVMIMIAEMSCRRQGFGREALLLLLQYGIETLGVGTFDAKISAENTASISLFTKIGFKKEEECKIFQEITLRKIVDDKWKIWLKDNAPFSYVQKKQLT